jgi:hypothetical protein
MTLEKQTQLYIMNIVFGIEDLQKLNILKNQVESLAEETAEVPDFMEAVKPIRDHIPLEEIMEKQNYKPIDFDTFRERVGDFDWGEATLEELLAALD